MKKGISLITLIITIVVIIILAGAIILTIANNNPIEGANEAVFKGDLDNFRTELAIYNANSYLDNLGNYNPSTLQATSKFVEINGVKDFSKNITDIVSVLKNATKYIDKIEIQDGEVIFFCTGTKEDEWAEDIGIKVICSEPIIEIEGPDYGAVRTGTDVKYSVTFKSEFAISNIYTENIELVDMSDNVVQEAVIDLGSYIIDTDLEKKLEVTVITESIVTQGQYRIRIKEGTVINIKNAKNRNTVYSVPFEINNTVPIAPTITSNPTECTNQDVTVTIVHPDDSLIVKYSTDGAVTWQTYTAPFTVSQNLTVYAKCVNYVGTESESPSNHIIDNIDKIAPVVTYATNGTTNVTTVGTVVNVSDVGCGGLDTGIMQYVWDTQNTTQPTNGWISFTNGQLVPKTGCGIYYLWIRAIDGAGNIKIEKSNPFTITYPIAKPPINDGTVATASNMSPTHTSMNGAFPSYNNPIVPAGFVAVNTSTASWANYSTTWNNGLVIQDVAGNQFVWVPVDGTNVKYEKWCTIGKGYNEVQDDTSSTNPINYSEIYSSVAVYKGFYVARYEAVFDYNGGNIRAASKRSTRAVYDSGTGGTTNWATARNSTHNGYLWNWITYADSKRYASEMATKYGYDTTLLNTNLITGTQWDALMRWLKNSGFDVENDSTSWGNYGNASFTYQYPTTGTKTAINYVLLNTGATTRNSSKNIFDVAGNVWEWSSETYTTSPLRYINRGGCYGVLGGDFRAAYRKYDTSDYIYDDISFRTSLYTKLPSWMQ